MNPPSNNISSSDNKKICSSILKYDTPSTKICGDIYKEEEINRENNRSRSNDLFENTNFDRFKISSGFHPSTQFQPVSFNANERDNANNEKLVIRNLNTLNEGTGFTNKHKSIKNSRKQNTIVRKKLSNYIPLNIDCYKKILEKATRNFSIEFVEGLLKKLSKEYAEHSFINDSYFVKYMIKVLDNELLSEEAANNIEHKKENEYLATIEDSVDTSRVERLKRRIASIFDGKTAYRLLTEYEFPEKYEEESFEYKIRIKKEKKSANENQKEQGQELILSEYYMDLLLREVRNIFGSYIKKVEIGTIEVSDICSKKELLKKENKKDSIFESACNKNKQDNESNAEQIQQGGIWGRAREKLIEKYGIEIDQSWFKKLEVSIDEEGREARFLAPTTFIRDWVKNNYLREIEKTITMLEPSIEICNVNVGMYNSSCITSS